MSIEFQRPTYTYRVKEVVKVIDGDTIDVQLDVGFATYVRKRLRFMGINTWEKSGAEKEKGLLAKARLEELLDGADNIYVQTIMDSQGKYGRLLAYVWVETTDKLTLVNTLLVEEGHGVEYMV